VEEVQSLDWDTMQPVLAALQEVGPSCAIWFALPDGTYYTVSNGLMDQQLSDRPYFTPLFGGEEILGDVVVSKSTGQLSAVVATPIYVDEEVAGALGASIFISELADNLAASLELAEDMQLLVLNGDGQTVFSLPADQAAWMDNLGAKLPAEEAGTIAVDQPGQPMRLIYQVSDFNGWCYVLGR
jgi:methyl-accepting chemotaxis protein